MTSIVWTPPAIPSRRPGWERGYVAVLEHHAAQPFAWRASDCLAVPAALAKAMTGVDPMRGLRTYSTETGALRVLARLGFASVEDALAAVFPDVPLMAARRGDCGVLEQIVDGKAWLTTLIVTGDRAMGKGPRGPVIVPTLRLKRTFAIGAF